MSWEKYSENAQLAVGNKLLRYAIFCHNGAKCCSTPQDFSMDQSELAQVVQAVNDGSVAQGCGIRFEGIKYVCLNWDESSFKGSRKESTDNVLAENEKYFLYIRKCSTLVIIGCIQNDPTTRNALIDCIDKQWELLHNTY